MGDSCYLEIVMRESDCKRFEEKVNEIQPGWGGHIWNSTMVENNVFIGTMNEVNYGWESELQELAQAGFRFHGYTGAGGVRGRGICF